MERDPTVQCVIYVITCQSTDKQYIGQTVAYEKTKGKPRVYDLRNKLAEYVETAQRESLTPLTHAICDHGAETFSIEKLEICNADVVDVRESMYIDAYGTLVPNGYNCYGTNVEAELKGINHRGQLGKVCLRVKVKV